MKAYNNAMKCKDWTKKGYYNIDKSHHILVKITGWLGEVPTTKDILKNFFGRFEFRAPFYGYYLFNNEIYDFTTENLY
jgi:hypothetical protein